MAKSIVRLAVVTALVLAGPAVVDGSAQAAAPPWTKITAPSHTFTYHFDGSQGAVNHLSISGQAEADVSSVDIFCIYSAETGVGGSLLASGVPVTSGSFNVVATVPGAAGICRLRALPSGLDTSPGFYLGAFSGPIMYTTEFTPLMADGKTDSFGASDGFGSGIAALSDASTCGVLAMVTRLVPDVQQRGPGAPMCMLGLRTQNLTNTGTPNGASIRVDGNNAYLPGSVSYLRDPSGFNLSTLTQSSLTTTYSRNDTTGEVKVTESSRLMRCNVDNTYPPTSVSCSSLVNTGVTFKRSLDVVQGHHQVLIHDSFVSNDGHAHTVVAQYQSWIAPGGYGAPGYIYPQHSATFAASSADKVVTGFGTGSGTLLVRSDLYDSTTDQQADTQALTWTRPPAKIQYAHDDSFSSHFAMPYTFHVPAGGAARIGFGESEAPLTSDAKTLAAKAVAAL